MLPRRGYADRVSILDRRESTGPRAIVADVAHDPGLPDEPILERHLTLANLLLVIGAVVIAAVGQVLLRHGMRVARDATFSGGSLVWHAATSPYVLAGFMVFAVSSVLWLAALSRVPLSVAYPFNALGYLGIITASAVVLHEQVDLRTWVGSAFVVTGLIIVVTSANSH